MSAELIVNTVVWIRSLPAAEQRPTERVHDDLQPYLISKGIPFKLYEPQSAADFYDVLSQLVTRAANGLRPILFIDIHGADKSGIFIDPTNEIIGWDKFVELLRPINVATKNNLCVVSAACFSLQSIMEMGIEEPVPYFIYIAAEREFYFEERKIVAFFEDVFDGLDIVSAHEKHLAHQTSLFHCERAFIRALVGYIREYCIGSGLQKRKEYLLSEAIKQGMPNTRYERRRARKAVESGVRPSQALIDRFVDRFLIGKKIAISIVDVMRIVRKRVADDERARTLIRKTPAIKE